MPSVDPIFTTLAQQPVAANHHQHHKNDEELDRCIFNNPHQLKQWGLD